MTFGTVLFLLLIAGSLLAMFSMHRGGRSTGMGGGCGGHAHNPQRDRGTQTGSAEGAAGSTAPPDDAGVQTREPRTTSRHRGCC